jgi:flavin reductase (DIM6/NTAB) family NADH-FMN oxidoreductase RutF
MEIDPENIPWKSIYKIMIGSIVPRPIGWISTVNEHGQPNLAPFSFFNAAGANPPHLVICPMIRGEDGKTKDTYNNIRQTGEFVANIVTETLAAAMNITSTEFPAGVDEFAISGLTPVPSAIVHPPRVLESPIHYECRLAHLIDLGDQPGASSVIVGRVVHIHVSDSVLKDTDKIDLSRLRPIGRLAGSGYCRVTDLFEMTRPPSKLVTST